MAWEHHAGVDDAADARRIGGDLPVHRHRPGREHRMSRPSLRALALFGALLSISGLGWAEQPVKERVAEKEVTGEVVAFTSRTLSLETGRVGGSIEEILFQIDPKVAKFERISSLKELQRGDRVRVRYQQVFQENEQGEERLIRTVTMKIAWLSRGVTGQARESASEGSAP
jgi:hypothetical protein